MKRLAAVLLLSLSSLSPSIAQANCDCSRYVSQCSAEIQLDKQRAVASLKTSAKMCARVTFVIDRTPYTSVFSGGATEEGVIIFQPERPLPARIRSCYVCATTDKAANGQSDSEVPKTTPTTLAEYLKGSWFYGSDDTTTVYTFDTDTTGTSTHTGKIFAGTGHVTCSGDPSHFSCTDNWATTFPNGAPFTAHFNYQGSRTDRETFTFGKDVIFTRR
jgi:hypothetical protein